MRWMLMCLLTLSLAACWVGEGLFSDSDARRLIEPGTYVWSTPDEGKRVVRVSLLPNGLTRLAESEDSEGKNDAYGFAPLDAGQKRFIAWLTLDESEAGKRAQVYFLVRRESASSYSFYIPECRTAEEQIARAGGATVEPGADPTCVFHNRAALERAMLQLRPVEKDVIHLVRIGAN